MSETDDWFEPDERAAEPAAARPRRDRSRAGRRRARPARSGDRRSGRRSGGGGGGLKLDSRLLIGIAAAIVLIIVIALVVRDCQRDQLVDSYKTYVGEVNTIVTDSNEQGTRLRTILANNQNETPPQLQRRIRQVENQAATLSDRADALDPPGSLNPAHQNLEFALGLRQNGLRQLADSLPELLGSNNENFAAGGLASAMQRFLASDVVYVDAFVSPAVAALEDDSITGLEIPKSDDLLFLPGTNTRFASILGAKALLAPLQNRSGGGEPTDAGNDQTGNLRGLALISVEAVPEGVGLTPDAEVSVSSSESLKWKITVENGGDFTEENVIVRATFTYPDTPDEEDVKEGQITIIMPKQVLSLEIPGPSNPRLGEAGNLEVQVVPVTGEAKTDNNRAEYPVSIAFN